MVTKDIRFRPQKSEVPGPGNYEVRCVDEYDTKKARMNGKQHQPMYDHFVLVQANLT